jgi:hypothetical protein
VAAALAARKPATAGAAAGSSSGGSSTVQAVPSVELVASRTKAGDVELTVVVPPAAATPAGNDRSALHTAATAAAAAAGSSPGIAATAAIAASSISITTRQLIFPRNSGSSSNSNTLQISSPSWDLISSSAQQLPLPLLYVCAVAAGLDLLLVLLLMLLGCHAARVGFWRHVMLIFQLKGGLRVPDFIVEKALQHMVKDGGSRLHLSNVRYWNDTGDGGKLPLVPRCAVNLNML